MPTTPKGVRQMTAKELANSTQAGAKYLHEDLLDQGARRVKGAEFGPEQGDRYITKDGVWLAVEPRERFKGNDPLTGGAVFKTEMVLVVDKKQDYVLIPDAVKPLLK
jgi:hypothetical protein